MHVTGKLVEGELIQGHHPALIDLKLFLEVQDILNSTPVVGVKKVSRHDELPLKIFAKDELSGCPLSGYKTRGHWYYKTKEAPVPVNISANRLNELFVTLLRKYELNHQHQNLLKTILAEKLRQKLAERYQDTELLKKKLSEKKSMLEKAEQKYIADEISREVYQKHTEKLSAEIAELGTEMQSVTIRSSNIEKAVEKCLVLAQNLSQSWVSAGFEQKQRLQRLVFPEGILYNKQKGEVRTERVNSLFAAIPLLAQVSAEKKKGDSSKNRLKSSEVPRTGFEPARPFGHHHLKVACLPISTPGLGGANVN